MPGCTRRECLCFLASLPVAGALTGCEGMIQRPRVVRVDEWAKGACRFCGTGCAVEIGMHRGEVVDVRGHASGHNRGRLCIKGIATRWLPEAPGRLLYPMVRENGELRRASWDEALDRAAAGFQDVLRETGPQSVAYYGSGQLATEESYTANKLFKAGLRTNHVDGNPRLCMASAAVGYTTVFGKDEPLGCYDDFDEATFFFIIGANMAAGHPVLWERVLDRKRSRPETRIVVVDPRRTRTAARADLHLALRPGTDIILLNAVLREVIERGWHDEEMVEGYLTFQDGERPASFAEYREFLRPFTAERAAAECDLPVSQIHQVAELFGRQPAALSLWTMGLNQQLHGVATNRQVMALHLLTGQIGRPGATPFSLTGQPNAGGGVRDTGSLAHALPAGRRIASAEDRAEMERHWGVPEGTIHPEPGRHAVAIFDGMLTGAIRACLVMATNPAQSLPNADRYHAGMERAFLVVADAFAETETTRFADVLLPAALWVEKQGIYSQSERRYHHTPKLIEPPGEARSDLEILLALADRLGLGDLLPARTNEEIWDEWRQISKGTPYDFSGMTYERLRREVGILWPAPTEDHPGTCHRYVPGEDPLASGEGRFDFYGRPDRRAVLHFERPIPHTEQPDGAYPLFLTTGRVLEHWHTSTMTGHLPGLEEIRTDFLEIHPYDAGSREIGDGDRVEVRSRRGAVELAARVTSDIRPGTVFATFHPRRPLVNRVTSDATDPLSRQPEFKRAAVEVRRLTEGEE